MLYILMWKSLLQYMLKDTVLIILNYKRPDNISNPVSKQYTKFWQVKKVAFVGVGVGVGFGVGSG